jgi:ABC-type sugar transport system ATPase subunit
MENIILRMMGITKQFPGVLALDHVDLELRAGEVLALVGENGAGKSTLLKILSGAYAKDQGEIELDGKPIENYTPNEAIGMGISIIYQELDNYKTLTVAENILVNNLPRKGNKGNGRIDWKETYRKAQAALNRITEEIDAHAPMHTLSAAKQQLVEIAKAMNRNMRILIMDEPTSALNRVETKQLLKLVRQIADSGVGVIYISHRMDEIMSISDRVQVMRDGRSVSLLETKQTSHDEIIGYMVGRTLDEMYPHQKLERGDVILELKGVSAGRTKDISFQLHKGEILGFFGLMGAGRTDVARALFGDLAIREGEVLIQGKKAGYNSPAGAIKNGIAYVPSERKLEGLMLIHQVKFNISVSILKKLMRRLKLNARKEEEIADKWIKALKIRTPDSKTKVESLSGGNQQKVVLAKWLETDPKILILNDPTRGIDVGAKVEIYSLMEELCAKGIGIIMISSELQETLAMSDRVLVLCEGKLTGEISREDATQESLMKLAVGGL